MTQPFDEANVTLLQGRRIAWLEIELSILASLADLLDARRPLDEILGELGNRCLDGSGLSSGALFLFDPQGKLEPTATLGRPPGLFLDADRVALLIAALGPEDSPVVLSQPFTIEPLASALNQSPEQSIVLAPLRSAGLTVGYLLVATTQAPLDDDWIAFASAIANHLSSAIGQAEARSHLEESEALHRAVVENLAEGVTVTVDGLRVVVNEAYLTILGLEKKSEAEGLPATGWVVPDDKARVESIFTRVLDGEEVAPYEVRVQGGDGGERLLVVSTKRISYGGQSAALSVLNDITDQRRDQEAVAQSAIDYRTIVETVQEGIWTIDATGATTFANDRLAQMFGYSIAEMLGKSALDFVHPESRPAAVASLAKRVEGVSEQLDVRFQRKDGVDLWAIVSATPLVDDAGAYVGALASLADITERRAAEEHCRIGQRQLEQAERVAHLGHWQLELATDELTWSDEHYRIFGREPSDGAPSLSEALAQVHLDDRPAIDESMRRTTTEGAPFDLELRVIHPDGKLVNVESRGQREIDAQGVARLIGTAQDITARKQAEQELRHSEELLRQAQKMEAVGNLAGGIAHDFNNLLTAIIGFGQMGLAEVVEGDVRTYLEEVVSAGERAATLTRQLLAFSRRQVMHLEIIDVNTVVTDMGRMLSRIIGENIQLDILLDSADTSVQADPGQIEQVVLNLAVNARAAMGLGAVLTIQTHNVELAAEQAALYGVKPGPYVQLAVTDTGVGIPEGDLAQIFEPFFTTKPQGEGTGMGLATVYGIVKQSEGHISVYSEVGVGTTFNIYLPRADAVPMARPVAETRTGSFRGDETILLVEDEAGVRELALAVLEGAGYTVLAAARPEAALDALAHHAGHIELLLTDVVMPGMNGPTLAARVEQTRPDMKVLFMSGYPGDALRRQGTLQNDAAYIDKPFRPRALAEKVREVLDEPVKVAEPAPAA